MRRPAFITEGADGMYPVSREHIGRIERLACIGETATEIVHDLNNQLSVLLGYIAIAREGCSDDVRAEYLDGIMDACERCCREARRILSFARGAGAERQRQDLRAMVMRPLELHARLLREERIAVRTRFPDERVEVVANGFELGQVVCNILHNARHELLKVTRRVFEVACVKREGKAVVRFHDSGPGIEGEHRERIFEPFYTTKPGGEGTGLGLSIARRIVEAHGGTLRADEGEDGGAAFVLELPLAKVLSEYCGSALADGFA